MSFEGFPFANRSRYYVNISTTFPSPQPPPPPLFIVALVDFDSFIIIFFAAAGKIGYLRRQQSMKLFVRFRYRIISHWIFMCLSFEYEEFFGVLHLLPLLSFFLFIRIDGMILDAQRCAFNRRRTQMHVLHIIFRMQLRHKFSGRLPWNSAHYTATIRGQGMYEYDFMCYTLLVFVGSGGGYGNGNLAFCLTFSDDGNF